MSMADRVGYFSSYGLFLIGVLYVVVVAIGIYQAGFDHPITDPILAVMEVITLLSAPFIIAVMASVYETANPERRVFGVMALTFAGVMAGLTCAVHFIALTAGRQTGFTVLEWPSTLYAVELLAWDVFLGLSLLSASFVFVGSGASSLTRWSLFSAGALSLTGAIGPVAGNMALQRIGILGYGIGLPVAALMLSRSFRTLRD